MGRQRAGRSVGSTGTGQAPTACRQQEQQVLHHFICLPSTPVFGSLPKFCHLVCHKLSHLLTLVINSELPIFSQDLFPGVSEPTQAAKVLRNYPYSLIHRDVISPPVVIPGFHCYWVWRRAVTREGYEVTPLCCIIGLNPGRSMCDLLRNHFSCIKINVSSVREKAGRCCRVKISSHPPPPKKKTQQKTDPRLPAQHLCQQACNSKLLCRQLRFYYESCLAAAFLQGSKKSQFLHKNRFPPGIWYKKGWRPQIKQKEALIAFLAFTRF